TSSRSTSRLRCACSRCTCCTSDGQRAAGEAYVLDQGLLEELVERRSDTARAPGELCILSGLTGVAPRGNEDMRAYGLSPDGGSGRRIADPRPTPRRPRSALDERLEVGGAAGVAQLRE